MTRPLATPPGPRSPFAHLGLLHTDAADLVDAVHPTLRRALGDGAAVVTVVERRTARLLGEALGDDAALRHRAPAEVLGHGPEGLAAEIRAQVRAAGGAPVVLLLQYPASDAEPAAGGRPGAATVVRESSVAHVLADLPATLVCACSTDGDPDVLRAARRGHPRLLVGGEHRDNPRFRPPPDRSPAPASLWGARALRMSFRDAGELREVRDRVARVAIGLGLDTDETDAAVLAVHEAALLAADPEHGTSLVEVRTSGGAMLTEVSGPDAHGADGAAPDTGDVPVEGGRAVDGAGSAADGTDPTLRVVRLFAGTAVHTDDRSHAVRVLTAPGRRGAPARHPAAGS